MVANVAGNLLVPFINRKAIKADYLSANARQLQSVYNYQRVILNAFTEVVNRLTKVENYRKSIEIKKQQLAALEASVEVASRLFQRARAEYVDVLLPWHRRNSYEPDAPARGVPQSPRWRVGLVCARMRNFLAGVIFAQRDLRDARTVLVETKQQQLSAIVNTYQALGGGLLRFPFALPQAAQGRVDVPDDKVELLPLPLPAVEESTGNGK